MARRPKEESEAIFRKLGIDYSRPGFYDTPEFKAVEKKDPAFIAAYGEYVDSLDYSEDYLETSRREAVEAASFLFGELVKDGRRGACIDASGVLQRILDRQGIWNYFVGGGVRIQFPASSGIRNEYFWPIVHPDNPAKTGHAWLHVPPFKVVDITLPVQGYSRNIAEHFEGFIAVDDSVPSVAEAGDLYETEVIEMYRKNHGTLPTLDNLHPQQRQFMSVFPAFEVTYGRLKLKYIPMHISAMDSDLENMQNLCLSGKYPGELYREYLALRGS